MSLLRESLDASGEFYFPNPWWLSRCWLEWGQMKPLTQRGTRPLQAPTPQMKAIYLALGPIHIPLVTLLDGWWRDSQSLMRPVSIRRTQTAPSMGTNPFLFKITIPSSTMRASGRYQEVISLQLTVPLSLGQVFHFGLMVRLLYALKNHTTWALDRHRHWALWDSPWEQCNCPTTNCHIQNRPGPAIRNHPSSCHRRYSKPAHLCDSESTFCEGTYLDDQCYGRLVSVYRRKVYSLSKLHPIHQHADRPAVGLSQHCWITFYPDLFLKEPE